MRSPTARTLQRLRSLGWTADVTERWLPKVNKRKDLFGFCDVLCMRPDKGFLAIQSTSRGNVSHRLRKIQATPAARTFLLSGGRLEIWGWARSKASQRWKVRKRVLTLRDFACVNL